MLGVPNLQRVARSAIELTPLAKFLIKCRFRAMVRRVIENAYWLVQGIDDYQGNNVQKRVENVMSKRKGGKPLLDIYDKALLNKPAQDRTEKEKRYLYRIIGDLRCFKRYPRHVKRKLAAVAYYKYYGPNRTIVRENHDAHALYFIVAGDVQVTHIVYDPIAMTYHEVELLVLHPGDMFGEVSLLHNIKRTATCTTIGEYRFNLGIVTVAQGEYSNIWSSDHCELLVLMKDDFKNVLHTSIKKQWDDIQTAMSTFSYFNTYDEVTRREGTIVAKMKTYEVDDIIFGDGVGIHNYIYFVVSGQCQMIESLQIIVKNDCGHISYTLFDPDEGKEGIEQDLDEKYFKTSKRDVKIPSVSDSAALEVIKNKSASKTISHISKNFNTEPVDAGHSKDFVTQYKSTSQSQDDSADASRSTVKAKESGERGKKLGQKIFDSQRSNMLFNQDEIQDYISPKYSEATIDGDRRHPANPNLKTFFMQVCQLNPGATFGFGENMRDRRIVALTPVTCMLLPKMWLLQRNTANIWTRIQHYMMRKIPKKRQLFDVFISTQQWKDFKDQVVKEVVSRSNAINWTSVHDVPYSIRMEEMVRI